MRKTLLIVIAVLVLLLGSSCSGAGTEGEKDNSAALLVPDVVGMELEDAKAAIKASGLIVGNIEYVESNDTGKELVSNQDPLPGEEIKMGEQINLTVAAAANGLKTMGRIHAIQGPLERKYKSVMEIVITSGLMLLVNGHEGRLGSLLRIEREEKSSGGLIQVEVVKNVVFIIFADIIYSAYWGNWFSSCETDKKMGR